MNSNIRIGSLFGIPFYVNPSWFLVLGLVTWSYGSGIAAQFPGLIAGAPWLLGLVTALLLFASVLAHELGHSAVALRQGINVQSITLFLFGGLASLEEESKTPAEAFWVAIAGPIVSLLLFGVFSLGSVLTGAGWLATILSVLASVNLALALFNLIPGLPLDGGNILKALVWKLTGNPYKGVVVASRVGQVFGWVAIASGLLPALFFGSFGNIWNLLIGGFLLQNAGRMAQAARIQDQFTGLVAADAVSPNSPVVSAELSLRAFADQRILSRDNWRKFLVVNEEGQLVGEIAVETLQTVPVEQWSDIQVQALMQPAEAIQTIESHQPLLDVVKRLEEKQLPALTVIRENGVLVGLLEKSSILAFLQRRTQATAA
jgi:Zn-dependent protease/predicted transcriptional regulator